MAKLTDTQLIFLSNAAAGDDGIAIVPVKMNKAAASKVGASLLARKLMRELRSKPGMPIRREDDDGRPISLMITRAGRDAIGSRTTGRPKYRFQAKSAPKRRTLRPVRSNRRTVPARRNLIDRGTASPRPGSKQARVIEMLCAKKGATLKAPVEATGWLPHTTRAALTGLRKRAFSIERTREDGSDSIYRIVATPEAAAA